MQDSSSYAGYETTLRNEAEKAQAKVKGGAKKVMHLMLLCLASSISLTSQLRRSSGDLPFNCQNYESLVIEQHIGCSHGCQECIRSYMCFSAITLLNAAAGKGQGQGGHQEVRTWWTVQLDLDKLWLHSAKISLHCHGQGPALLNEPLLHPFSSATK